MMARMPYVVKRRELLFWQPTREMQAKGFLPKPLGPDSPESRAEAKKLYDAWFKLKTEGPKVTDYPAGTLGAFYDRYRRLTKWGDMKPRSHEDYERAWKHIDAWKTERGETLARTVLTRISTEDCEALFKYLADGFSASERYRTIKCLKILLKDAMVRLRLPMQSPAATLKNPAAAGRAQIWLGAEIETLAKTAFDQGFPGMGHAIRVAWDTMFSPVDVWTLTRPQIKQDGQGRFAERDRTKTDKHAYGALSEATATGLMAYIEGLGVELTDDAPIIRQRNGQAYRSKDTFGDDFRAVRLVAFGPTEKRQFLDIRRSANVEADAAGADKATMGELLANGLANNNFLDATYTPPTVAKAREVAIQRLEGRRKLAGEMTRIRSKSIS